MAELYLSNLFCKSWELPSLRGVARQRRKVAPSTWSNTIANESAGALDSNVRSATFALHKDSLTSYRYNGPLNAVTIAGMPSLCDGAHS